MKTILKKFGIHLFALPAAVGLVAGASVLTTSQVSGQLQDLPIRPCPAINVTCNNVVLTAQFTWCRADQKCGVTVADDCSVAIRTCIDMPRIDEEGGQEGL